MKQTTRAIHQELVKAADPQGPAQWLRYFKCGPGQYGERDKFLGVKLGPLRDITKKYQAISLEEVEELLQSPWHEERTVALVILKSKSQRLIHRLANSKALIVSGKERKTDHTESNQVKQQELTDIYQLYLKSIAQHINNWDLVDISAPAIVGGYLQQNPKDVPILEKLAVSTNLWERRVAIMATAAFISAGQFELTIKIANILLLDKHDLIHKAVGWMLREVGKKDQGVEESFLAKHYQHMPRTMLRYAIEKFPEPKRQAYLAGTI